MKNIAISIIFCHLLVNAQETNSDNKYYKIAVIGTGYVGLVLGAGLAEFGHYVECADIDQEKVNKLNDGIIPIFEPGLSELVKKNCDNNSLLFTSDVDSAIQKADIVFIAVGTPTKEDGKADVSAVLSVVTRIGKNLNGHKIICTKSTVPIGMSHTIQSLIQPFETSTNFVDIVSNPEFLREGTAVQDFFNPDRVVIGANSEQATKILCDIYKPLLQKNIPFLITDIASSETIKYASNGFLAVKLSFINEIARLCEKVGANCYDVAKGIGLDPRIGNLFLKPGPGYGGSCLPKDTKALLSKGKEIGLELKLIKAAIEANDDQKSYIVEKIKTLLHNNLAEKTIAIWGLAFKANTDDIRESCAITIVQQLLEQGAHIKAYDPIASNNMRRILPDITYCSNKEDALEGADVLVILTDWQEFTSINTSTLSNLMKQKIIYDTRNILCELPLRTTGFTYCGLGK